MQYQSLRHSVPPPFTQGSWAGYNLKRNIQQIRPFRNPFRDGVDAIYWLFPRGAFFSARFLSFFFLPFPFLENLL